MFLKTPEKASQTSSQTSPAELKGKLERKLEGNLKKPAFRSSLWDGKSCSRSSGRRLLETCVSNEREVRFIERNVDARVSNHMNVKEHCQANALRSALVALG